MRKKIFFLLSFCFALTLMLGAWLYVRSNVVSAHGVTDGRHGVNVNGPSGQSVSESVVLADRIAETGVKYAFLPVLWAWAEPQPPTTEDTGGRWQGPSSKWHLYNLDGMDAMYAQLRASQINVIVGMYYHPQWAGGQPCNPVDKSCENLKGLLYNSHKAIFSEALKDLASNLAMRYPDAYAFSVWNEPNGFRYFSPQPPLNPDPVGEYLNRVFWPAKTGINERRQSMGLPPAKIIGPELAAPNNYAWGPWARDENWHDCCGFPDTDWLDHWIGPLLQFFPNEINVYTFHTYASDWQAPIYQVSRLKDKMSSMGHHDEIWLSETNMKDFSTCTTPEVYAANHFCKLYLYNDAWWTKTFYFGLSDGHDDSACGSGLLHSQSYSGGAWAPKWLHEAFHAIVDRNYGCS